MSGETRVVLDELLLKCHNEHSVLFHDLQFHKHDSHHLGSLFYLGADSETLKTQCETSVKQDSDPEQESPHKITIDNWKESIGDKKFCKSYRLFFDEQLHVQDSTFDWKTRVMEFLKEEITPGAPFISGLGSGLVHPLISLGYAFELNSAVVASEALTLNATCYNYLHKILDGLTTPKGSMNPYEILDQMHNSTEFSTITAPGVGDMQEDVEKYSNTLLSFFNNWNFAQFSSIEYLFDFSTYIFLATHTPNKRPVFDFFLLHVLTGLNAIRTLLQVAPEHFGPIQDPLVQHWFFITLIVFMEQLRPKISKHLIDEGEWSEAKNWGYIDQKLLTTKLMEDVHIIKVARALMDARSQWGDKGHFYLKGALLFVDQVDVGHPFVGNKNDKELLNVGQKN